MSCAHHKYGICALKRARPEELPGACETCPFRTIRPPNKPTPPPQPSDGREGRVRKICVSCREKRAALNEATIRRVRGEG